MEAQEQATGERETGSYEVLGDLVTHVRVSGILCSS